MGGGDPSCDIKVLDLLGSQFEVNSHSPDGANFYPLQILDSRKYCQFKQAMLPHHQFVQIGPEMSVDNR